MINASTAPLIVLADDGLHVFRSAAAAALYLEPIDVRDGEYTAYDIAGRPVALGIHAVPYRTLFGLLRRTVEHVSIGKPGGMSREAELRQRLSAALRDQEARIPEPGPPLGALVEAFVARFGYTGG